LAACAGAQPPIGAPGVMPQSQNSAIAARGRSWMLPGTSGADLLYVSDGHRGIIVYSYPALKQVGEITGLTGFGLCSDKNGDVFVPTSDGGFPVVYEYPHGGTQPIATLSEYGDDLAIGCSVDPTTGNLAVTNNDGNYYYHCQGWGNVAIFANAQGKPTTYCTGPAVGYAFSCGYDDAGNLYVDGAPSIESHELELGELPAGSTGFAGITLNRHLQFGRSVQWDGSYITIETGGRQSAPRIYRVQVSNSNGRIVSTTAFNGIKSSDPYGMSWIQENSVLMPGQYDVGLFSYPGGGKAIRRIAHVGRNPVAVTVSVVPSGTTMRETSR
jgi:hypothetical protein